MAADDIFGSEDMTQVRQGLSQFRRLMMQEMRRTTQDLTRIVEQKAGADNLFTRIAMPTNKTARSSMGLSAKMKQTMKKGGSQLKNFMTQIGSSSQARGMKMLQTSWDKTGQAIKAAGENAKNAARWMKEAAKAAPGGAWGATKGAARGAAGFAGKGASVAGKGLKGVGKAAMKVGMFGGGSLLGFVVSAFREGVANYEQTQRAKLDAATTMGYNAKFAKGGARFGYNAGEAARVQAQGAAAGITGEGGGLASFRLMRTLGQQGLQQGGGIMARGGLSGRGGIATMMKTLEKTMALAMETGLDRARLPEYLGAIQSLSEEQIRVTPGKDQWNNFAKELAFMQARGGKGFAGKYAGAALSQAHQAIKGASGPGQALMMRAFGFGKGANLIDVLKRQEMGASGGNIMAVMQQLQSEYGAGKGGGLSDAGKLAFKGTGMGSLHMAEKFSDIYLQRKKGTITAKQAQEKIKGITEEGKLGKMPTIQRQAYETMSKFGDVVQRLAARFDSFAELGANSYFIVEGVDKISKGLVKTIIPIFKGLKPFFKELPKMIQTILPTLNKISKHIEVGLKVLFAYLKAPWGSKGDAARAEYERLMPTKLTKEQKKEMKKVQQAQKALFKPQATPTGDVAAWKKKQQKKYQWEQGGKYAPKPDMTDPNKPIVVTPPAVHNKITNFNTDKRSRTTTKVKTKKGSVARVGKKGGEKK